ncbi:MAG TPA: histidine phosphatase family protein [Pyrinomonadaceae bacterium]|nr:histidine phosphatase family protein [Pyrinomonadaceae bacterium]
MRTLYLLRHAKSSWKDATLPDYDRPLKDRGRKAAKRIGKYIAAEKLNNPLVVCSPAVRARETAEIVLKHAHLPVEVRYEERIYEASLRDLVQVVSEIPDDKPLVILIGHNPGFEELLAYLTGEGRRMPTCALAKIKFEVESWKDIKEDQGALDWFVTPKELEEED